MSDLLIVTAPFTYTFGPSLAPALLKACVQRDGFSCSTWDASAEFNFDYQTHNNYLAVTAWMQSPELKLSNAEFEWYTDIVVGYARRIVETYQPTALAISVLTQNSQRFVEDLCYHVRLLNNQIKIILGGSGLNIFLFQHQKRWHELILDSGLADCVLLGEGEYAIGQILKENTTGIVTVPQLTNEQLNAVPVPDYADYNFNLYPKTLRSYWSSAKDSRVNSSGHVFLITASKGCVKNCNFCDVGNIWSKFRYRNGVSVANEMIELHQKYQATYFSFTDSLINGGLKPFWEMNNELAQRLPDTIKYEAQMICRSQRDMPEKYFEAMARAGCHRVQIGMESGSEQIRLHMGKGSSADDVNYTTNMLIKYKIHQSWNIIAGYPTETDENWQETMKLIRHWVPRSNGLLKISPINTFLLLDGVPMTQDQALVDHFQMHVDNVNGYSSFAWVSAANPTNTFDIRVKRFIELCETCIDFENDSDQINHLQRKINTVKKQLDWYNDAKPQKIFSITKS